MLVQSWSRNTEASDAVVACTSCTYASTCLHAFTQAETIHKMTSTYHRRSIILLARHDLWCCIAGAATVDSQLLARDEKRRQAKAAQ